ncbi:transglycosylase family protein [Mycolicibacterium cosmeticum]|uniref:transglycosylase family protein n=1 Tax=Mycolicibacterium cosmeticum TaxID=258533 RepID=UPI003D160CF2
MTSRRRSAPATGASRTEQIGIAERVIRTQGLGAWPVCGRDGVEYASWYTPTRPDGGQKCYPATVWHR